MQANDGITVKTIKCEILDFFIVNKGLVISCKNSIFDSLTKQEILLMLDRKIALETPESNYLIYGKILDVEITFTCFGKMTPTLHLLTNFNVEDIHKPVCKNNRLPSITLVNLFIQLPGKY